MTLDAADPLIHFGLHFILGIAVVGLKAALKLIPPTFDDREIIVR